MRYIPASVSKFVSRAGLKVSKASPPVLLGVGVVGMIGTVVLASRATLKLEDILDETQEKLDQVEMATAVGGEKYTDDDATQDAAVIYIQAAGQILKLYSPAIVLGTASIVCLVTGHQIQAKRIAALTVAYEGLRESFERYRDRVREEIGEEKELEFYRSRDLLPETVDQNGKRIDEKPVDRRAFSRFFDEGCPEWRSNPESNRFYLLCQQNRLNDKLMVNGHVFLNEVYDTLGIERTQAGSVVGWVLDKNHSNKIDFGIFDDAGNARFINGQEPSVLLTFNVDGIIFDRI